MFVRYAYWTDVRMPPEQRIPHGVVEVAPAGSVAPTGRGKSRMRPAYSARHLHQ